MYIFSALREDGINSSDTQVTAIDPTQYANGGLIESIKKHPRKVFFKFEGGRYNIDGTIVKEAVCDNEIVCSNFSQFISEIIGCSNIDAIHTNMVVVSKHDNYFLLVFNFKSSSKDEYKIISHEEKTKHSISLVAKFIVVEDVSDDKSIEDILELTGGAVSGGRTYSDPITEIEMSNPSFMPPSAPIIETPAPSMSIHQQAAMGNDDHKWDSALNDNSYTGGPV